MTHESSIRWNLTNHPPAGELAEKALDAVTDILISTGEALAAILPDSREKSLTMTKLEETSMWAKAAIARNQPYLDIKPVTPTEES